MTKQGASLAKMECQNANSLIYHFLLGIMLQQVIVESTDFFFFLDDFFLSNLLKGKKNALKICFR